MTRRTFYGYRDPADCDDDDTEPGECDRCYSPTRAGAAICADCRAECHDHDDQGD